MELVVLVATLALVQFIYFSINVGKARGQYSIKAPAMSGHPLFERHLRVQMNTMEQLLVFIPVLFMFSWSFENHGWAGYKIAAAMGVIWIIGRTLYARAYIKDPDKRGPGFGLTFLPTVLMIAGTLVAVFKGLL
ncbi:MAG: MAPEG family protein [Gammaproteobacteria bacterium]|jgi:hypothetical protein